MKCKLAFIHTSPAAIVPLNNYYIENAPEFKIINLLDDGLLDFFNTGDNQSAINRIVVMVNVAVNQYGVKAAMVTCTAISRYDFRKIDEMVDVPMIKVDVPIAEKAVRKYQNIGLVATFPPGGVAFEQLLRETAKDIKMEPEINYILVDNAYNALLKGDNSKHDKLVLQAIEENKHQVDVFILSQVSMSGLKTKAKKIGGKPVLASPEESLPAIRTLVK